MWPFLAFLATAAAIATYRIGQSRCRSLEHEIQRLKTSLDDANNRHEDSASVEQSRQATLFNSMIEGVLVLDNDLKVQLTNRAFEQLFATGPTVRGKTIIEVVRSHQLQHFASEIVSSKSPGSIEFDLPGNTPHCIQVNGAVFSDADSRPIGTVLVFHDVTRIKQLENTRQEFVANVSHELRSPLTLIKGAAETLLDGAKDDPKSTTRFVQMILKHADRLTYLIEDLLTISKLEADQAPMNAQRLPVLPLAERVIQDLHEKAEKRGVSLRNEVPNHLTAKMDGDRIQQVLFNLVDNAIIHGSASGWVAISATEHEPGWLELSVEDNGPGIPEEARDRVFERFFRLDRARSRERGGTGLGLSIVKHIVLAHGGKVWVEGEPGKGARFCLTLPKAS